MNHDLTMLERKNYDILDVMSDVGGVHSVMISVFSVLLYVVNYQNFDSYMASRLFKVKKQKDVQQDPFNDDENKTKEGNQKL